MSLDKKFFNYSKKSKILNVFLIFTFLTLINIINTQPDTNQKKISNVNLLLPICSKSKCNPVYGKLQAFNGCYEWKTDNPKLLDLFPQQKNDDEYDCYSEVLITAKTINLKDIAYVSAKDKKTKESFKCKIEFGEVNQITIEKNFDSLNVGDTSELHVLARDEKGNLFSSLEGWKFHWNIKKGHSSAQFTKLNENGKLEIGKIREEIEKNAQSDIMLIKGIQTGKITVHVEIIEDKLKDLISPVERDLYIIEPFKIIPENELYILPNTNYNLNLIYTNSKNIIKSSEQRYFQWSVNDENCGTIKDFGKFKSGKIVCDVIITAKDKRLEMYDTDQKVIHVVFPNSLEMGYLEINEGDKNIFDKVKIENDFLNFTINPVFKLVESKSYIFKNFLMYDDKPIYYDINKIKFNFDLQNIHPFIQKNKPQFKYNQELALLTTNKITDDQSIQSSAEVEKGYNFISRKTVIIYERVRIKKFKMPFFTLPYLDSNWAGQELYLQVTGGMGKYDYTTSDPKVVNIIDDNCLLSKEKGIARIVVKDSEINSNFDEIDIHVVDINTFNYMEERQEVLVGERFEVTPIALQNTEKEFYNKYHVKNIFTNCTNLNLMYDKSNKDIVKDETNRMSINNYYKVRYYINNNYEAIKEKMNIFNVKNQTDEFDYFDYANYGICGNDAFVGKTEGLLKLLYKTTATINKNIISSYNPARIFIYQEAKLENILSDNFTEYLISKINLNNPDVDKNYLIAPHSELNLKVNGGIEPWSDHTKDYQEEIFFFDKKKNEVSVDKIYKEMKFKSDGNKNINTLCMKAGSEHDFMIKIHNKKDSTLLRPGISKIYFHLSCKNPDHLSLFLLSQTYTLIEANDFSLNEIFNDPQKKGIEYFIKKNSTDILRIYGFDSNKIIFVNMTNTRGSWDKNYKDSKYFDIIKKDLVKKSPNSYIKDKNIISYIYSDNNQEFIQDYVKFNDYASTFNLRHKLVNKVEHFCTIHMIDLPEMYPENATVYLREDNIFPLNVIKGSGDFNIELSDDSLASFNYDRNNRKIYLKPLKQGILIIKVKDNQLGKSYNYEIKSKIYISDVKKILLYGGGLLMNNKSTQLGIEIYDNFDNIFPEDQSKLINLQLNETIDGLDITFSENNSYINATGHLQGLYPIILRDMSSDILSNIAKIEVFDKLEVYPPYLLLVPGSSYTLSIIGGPQNKENVIIKYEIRDEKIANVTENYPEVYAKTYGETILKITLLYKYDYSKFFNINDDKKIINRTDVLCIENVSVRVDFPDSVEILGGQDNRKIYAKSTIRLLAGLKKKNELFTYGIGPFKFNWSVDNKIVGKIRYFIKKTLNDKNELKCEGDSCKLSNKNNNNDDNLDKLNDLDQNCDECKTSLISTTEDHNPSSSIGVFLYTFEEGMLTVSVTASISYPSPYKMHRPYEFKTSIKLNINDEVYVNLPVFYGNSEKKTGLYLIPFSVDHELHTNKDSQQSYSIIRQYDIHDIKNQNAKIISLTDSGRVTSYNREGVAYVSITQLNNKENINNQVPVTLPIFVSNFHNIFIEKTHTIIDMEVSQELILKVILQHYHGLLFAEKFEGISLRVVVSHPKIATAELSDFNSKLRIKAQDIGETNVILFEPISRKIYDVFKINVVQQTTLLNKIVIPVGGNINFFGKDPNKKKEISKNAEWISDNNKVMKVDPKTGMGVALSEGEATIALKVKNSQKIVTSTQILVRKIHKVSFDKTKLPKTFSDIKKNGVEFINEFKVPIVLYSADDEIFTDDKNDLLSIINPKIKIKCESDAPNFVKADEVNKDNIHHCIFLIRENKFGDLKSRRGWGKNMPEKPKDVNIQLTVEDSLRNKNSVQETIPFSSAFKIKNDIHTINMSYKMREYTLYIDNLNDLDIKISNDRLVKIEEVNKEKKYIKLKIPYSVDEDFKNVYLYLVNVLNGQKEEILINFNSNGTTFSDGSSNSITDYIFVFLLTCLVIVIGYMVLFSGRKTPVNFMNNFNNRRMNNQFGRGFPNMNNNNGLGFNNNNNNYMDNTPKRMEIYGNGMLNGNQENNFNNFNNNDFNTNFNSNSFNNTSRGGFNNMMGNFNEFSQPRGSMYNGNQQFRRSNIDMNGFNNQF